MNTSNNTVLITGGSAGIGFETAKLFLAAGNKIIITGRDEKRLTDALSKLPGATGIVSDVSNERDIDLLVTRLQNEFEDLNIVVNNAGKAHLVDLAASQNVFSLAQEEMLTNYLAIVRLNEKLIPLLKSKTEAAIVNVSSVVAFVPGKIPTYSASKAALHSYTQSLRISLERVSNIKVFELMPPLVNTEFSQAIGGSQGIASSVVAEELLDAIAGNNYEIRVGNTQYIYDLYRTSPDEALKVMNPA